MKGYVIADFLTEEDRERIERTASSCGIDLTFYNDSREAEGKISDGVLLYSSDPDMVEEMPGILWCQSPYAGTEVGS